MLSNKVELGELYFTPVSPGRTGFLLNYGTVEYNAADFSDNTSWITEWPVTLPVIDADDYGKQVFAGIVSETNNPAIIKPGSKISFSVQTYGTASNVSY